MNQPHDARLSKLKEALRYLAPNRQISREHLGTMQRLCDLGGEPFARDHYDPGHFTASAFVLCPDERRLLLILHKKLGLWLQPGGHIEPTDEDHVDAARREVLEETGLSRTTVLDSLFDIDIHAIPPHSKSPAHLHHDLRVLLRAHSTEVRAGDGTLAAKWFSFDEIVAAGEVLAEGAKTDDSVRRVTARLARQGG